MQESIDKLGMEKATLSNLVVSSKDKSELKNIDKLIKDSDKIPQINLQLTKIIHSVELVLMDYGLSDPLEKFEGMGNKVNLDQLTGKKFPAFRIVFQWSH